MSSLVVTLLVNFEPLSVAIVQSLMPSKSLLVCFEDDEQVRPPVRPNKVVGVGVVRVEIKDVNKFSSFVNYDFISIVLHCHVLMLFK